MLKKDKGKRQKRKKTSKTNRTQRLTIRLQKMKYASGNKRVFTKTTLTYGKDVTMFSRMQTTEVLLRWKYVRQAVGRAW